MINFDKLVENLTQNALIYALIGTTFRVYAWTVFCILLFLLFRTFEIGFKRNNISLKAHYLYLVCIPLALTNAALYTLNLEAPRGVLPIDITIFILGLLMLIASLLIYSYLKGRSKL
ncbi:MAG: hypothetical protein QT11_C0001G0437 [archaeon GW2011_AR20]|nr:MAG: hypothetical protein QT11_C0001G0437 [archaeon GW2011_AR20]AQS28110.1 hypothetical protein [uncultured archaeon]AQS28710.1 hypothetical protein [uncultured archaeon]AQS29185.1 hypothetical protein [uncultured archaeon]